MSDADDALIALARARVGSSLRGKYRVERVLGVGGMAFVYEAVHRNGRRVALKMLHPELSVRPDIRKRFLLEGLAANAVKHPGVVEVIDDDVSDDGAAFLVMELLAGRSVEDVWRDNGGWLPTSTVLAIARDLCDILAAAHDAGVIHRDLKPANLFVTDGGTLKVLDFGLARMHDLARRSGHTAAGAVLGTPAFLPPEQASGQIARIDAQTDLWAVGATMFTLLSGRTVHEGESAQHLVILSATVPPRSLATVLPQADEAVVRIVDRALAFEKSARWATARDMHRAICSAIDAPRALASTRVDRTQRAARRVDDTPTLESAKDLARLDALVGTRTSQPVSSSAQTQQVRRRTVRARMMRSVRTALALVPMTTLVWRRRALMASFGGVFLAGLVLILASVTARRNATSADPPLPLPSRVSASEPVEAGLAPSASAIASALAPAASANNPEAVGSTRTAAAASGGGGSRRGTAAVTRPGCSPPTFVDSNGITRWKEGCFF